MIIGRILFCGNIFEKRKVLFFSSFMLSFYIHIRDDFVMHLWLYDGVIFLYSALGSFVFAMVRSDRIGRDRNLSISPDSKISVRTFSTRVEGESLN
jgi:hypothetical protein